MTIEERVAYALSKVNEAIENDEDAEVINYWHGYYAGLEAAKRSYEQHPTEKH